MIATKTCSKCGKQKPAGEFTPRKTVCKPCRVLKITQWRKANPQKAQKLNRLATLKRHGLTSLGYAKLLAFQLGTCAICNRECTLNKRLSIDHDHTTNQIRGLLCDPCNTGLGKFKDDPSLFYAAADYLNDPPACLVLGLN